MISIKSSPVFQAFRASVPVLFGYIPIGIAFGFLLVKAGLEWYWAPIMCLTIYAGAAQYLAIPLITNGTALGEIALAIFLVNARHMVYGFSLLERFSHFRWAKPYLIFGLTDETYGLLTTVEPPVGGDHEQFDFWITLLDQFYWTLGSTLGAILGSVILWEAPGLEFALTALFIVLLVEQIRSLRRPAPFVLAALGVFILHLAGWGQSALTGGIVFGAGACFFLKGREDDE